MTNPQPSPRKSGWSPERRRKQSLAIRSWSPWTKSTGPRTASGMARAAQNAYKHGGRARPVRDLHKALTFHAKFLRRLAVYIRLRKLFPANELLAVMAKNLRKEGREATLRLRLALLMAQIMQKSCFLRPPAANS